MGQKKNKKRKKDPDSTGESSTHSTHSSGIENVVSNADHTISQALNEASSVLYPETSTPLPIPAKTSQATPISNIEKILKDTNDKISKQMKETNRKIDTILQKLVKLDLIEQKLDTLDSRLTKTEGKVKESEVRLCDIEIKTKELEKSVAFSSEQVHDFLKEMNEIKNNLKKSENEQCVVLDGVKRDLLNITREKEDIKQIKETMVYLQCRSMRYNLVFTGLGGEGRDEDTESKLKDFMNHELGINWNIEFVNVHRFGKFRKGKNRPIVARFLYESDRVAVRGNAFKLKGTEFGIHEQFPQVIEERRKTLYPVMKAYRDRGHRTKLVRDRLYVDGKLYDGEAVARTQTPETSYGRQKQTTYPDAPQGPNPRDPRQGASGHSDVHMTHSSVPNYPCPNSVAQTGQLRNNNTVNAMQHLPTAR